MSYRVRLASTASSDAKAYAKYIRYDQKSPDAARKWLDGLYREIKTLEEMPDRFDLIPEAKVLGSPYRSFNYHSHRVVYLIDELQRLVTVHRIYHGARKPIDQTDV